MAVDKKGDHVGNHGGAYIDINGMSRQFTIIDHDRHTSRTKSGRESEESKLAKQERLANLQKEIATINQKRILATLSLPPYDMSIGETDPIRKIIFSSFLNKETVCWDENVVKSACEIDTQLSIRLFDETWKHTIPEQNWYVDMSYDDIISGKWKELI